MKASLTVVPMVTVAPLTAATALIWYMPSRWGGTPSVTDVLAVALFGLLSAAIWPTFIPALVALPFLMHRLAGSRLFASVPLPALLGAAAATGAFGGACVFLPIILEAAGESSDLAFNWLFAGSVAGAVTLLVITALYRASVHERLLPSNHNA